MADISGIRKDFTLNQSLSLTDAPKSPFTFFNFWFNQALAQKHLSEPNGFVLSTTNENREVNSRTVLLKYFDKSGFVFFTNYNSKKAKEIKLNPNVSACFPWYVLERQIIINGHVEKISTSESMKYFLSRPKNSQLGAWVSQQSEVISSRKVLTERLVELKNTFRDKPVPYPSHWGGFRIVPRSIEFWQGQPSRLHDRLQYSKHPDNSWIIKRLSP